VCLRPRYLTGIHNGLILYSGASRGLMRYVSDDDDDDSSPFLASESTPLGWPSSAVCELVDGVGSMLDVLGPSCGSPGEDALVSAVLALPPFVSSKSTTQSTVTVLLSSPYILLCL